ncbi:MAG: nucleotidyltransferase family protein [Terriglobales bacterium]
MNAAASFPAPSSTLSSAPGPRPLPELVLAPEFELLLECCAETSNSERAQHIRRIVSDRFDWDRMLRLAECHRLIPRVYERLSALDIVPAAIIEALRARYGANAQRGLWFTSELIRIVAEFEARGIEVLPYKGPTLAETLYADVTMRQFGDLDLLIHAADVGKAKTALLDLGYSVSIQLTEQQERAYLASGYEYTFDSAFGRNLVELKWQILPRFYAIDFDVEAMFDSAATLSLGGHSLRTLCAEDHLLVLCVHAAKHAWSQLSWLDDLTQLVKQRMDWIAIEKQSTDLGIERIVAVNFLLAHKLLRAPLPEMVEKFVLSDQAIEVLAGEIMPTIVQSMEYNTESISYFRLMMKVRERWLDRVRFLWRLVFTPTPGDWSAVRLATPLFPLYRLVRMFRLSGKLLDRRG